MVYIVRNCFLHLLTRNDLPGLRHSRVCTNTYLVIDGRLKFHKYCTRYLFARTCLGKKMSQTSRRLFIIESDAVSELVDISGGIAPLDTALAKMD